MHAFLRGNPSVNAVVASIAAVAVLLASFAILEPVVTHGQDATSNDFTVSAAIGAEISFGSQPTDVDMTGSPIAGLTGGTRFGTSTFSVTTNNAAGYQVRLAFATVTAMQGENLNTDIDNYQPGANPNYNAPTAADTEHFFAYTIHNETTPLDIDDKFEDNGASDCSGSGTATEGKCWFNKADASVEEELIDSTAGTATTGATSSIGFVVVVGTNSGLENGTYTATGTLTAYLK